DRRPGGGRGAGGPPRGCRRGPGGGRRSRGGGPPRAGLRAPPPAAPPPPPPPPAPPAPAPAATAAVAATARWTGVAGPDSRELLGRLALDVGVVGEAQADPAALLVDLDDGDVDLVALVEDVLDRADPLARFHVGDVEQA